MCVSASVSVSISVGVSVSVCLFLLCVCARCFSVFVFGKAREQTWPHAHPTAPHRL